MLPLPCIHTIKACGFIPFPLRGFGFVFPHYFKADEPQQARAADQFPGL
jgi:hypothetical protein